MQVHWQNQVPSLITPAYIYPNDRLEQERQDLQYEMLRLANDGRIFFAQLLNPERILDVGTGTGQWVMEMGEKISRTG